MPASDTPEWNLETVVVQSGIAAPHKPAAGTPTVPPIYPSTTYIYEDADALDKSFEGKTPEGETSFVYARHGNPSVQVFEEALATIEGGVGAVAFGSGMAAMHSALLAAGLVPGAKVLTSNQLFGPTSGLLNKVFIPNGIQVVTADLGGDDAAERIRAEQPDVILVEMISNPLAQLVDIAAISAAAQECGAVTIVDSTIASPYLIQPIKAGCDLVMHSATKYISGHGDSTAGIVISAKNTLLDQLRLFRMLTGGILSPFEVHLLMRGLRTLALRAERQCQNAIQVANFLQQHPAVAAVHFTGLPDNPQHGLADHLFGGNRYGSLMAFELRDQSRAAVYQVIDHLHLCRYATTLGDVFTLVSYPTVSSHRNLTPEERAKRGITEGCIRLSVGIEQIGDIIADLAQALQAGD